MFTARRKGHGTGAKCTFKWGTKVTVTHRSSLVFYINDFQSLYSFSASSCTVSLQYSFYRFKNISAIIFYWNNFREKKKDSQRTKQMKTPTYLKACVFSHRLFCLCKPISLTKFYLQTNWVSLDAVNNRVADLHFPGISMKSDAWVLEYYYFFLIKCIKEICVV